MEITASLESLEYRNTRLFGLALQRIFETKALMSVTAINLANSSISA